MNEELARLAREEVLKRRDDIVENVLRIPEAVALVSQLQLALRHPRNVGWPADVGRQTAEYLIEQIAPEPGPLRELLDAGWSAGDLIQVVWFH